MCKVEAERKQRLSKGNNYLDFQMVKLLVTRKRGNWSAV